MKVLTLVGTRPEIIRLSLVIPALDRSCEHVLVHTGQNHDPLLSDVFFEQLAVRAPDEYLGVGSAGFAEQAGLIMSRVGEALARHRPDRVLVLGDTNSGLGAIVAARMGVPVFHMEAGNRCYDDRVPEEINRRLIDHCSTVLMPYTHRSKEHLLAEGIARDRIVVTGNPIFEVLTAYAGGIDASNALARFGVEPGTYFLATLHRAENVDLGDRLRGFLDGLEQVSREHGVPVLVSVHPRTAARLGQFGVAAAPGIRLTAPLGFFDFVKLERHARAVLSDSGTVQEECAILRVPSVTLRDVTERGETIECGSNVLSGGAPGDIARMLRLALAAGTGWDPPAEYLVPHVAATVVKVVLGYTSVGRGGSPAVPPG